VSECFFVITQSKNIFYDKNKLQWLSPGTPVSSINKTDRHDITEILLKVALNSINQTNQAFSVQWSMTSCALTIALLHTMIYN